MEQHTSPDPRSSGRHSQLPTPQCSGGGICPYPPAGRGTTRGISSAGAQPTPPYGPVGKRIPLPHLPAGIPLGAHAWRSEERLTPPPRGSALSLPTHSPVGKRAPLPRRLVGKTRGISRGARATPPGRAPYTSGRSGRDPIADPGGVPLRRPAVPSAKRTRKKFTVTISHGWTRIRSAPPPEAQPHTQPRRSRLLPPPLRAHRALASAQATFHKSLHGLQEPGR